ncbi:MAG: TATA-box-binding protein [Euryarchaeota archaeon]|nr:TATA-box-binding protein [Euryarchaeota archaeon]
MTDMNIENIVASTQIADGLDIKHLADTITNSKYDPEKFPGLVLHIEKPKTAVLLFSSGNAICTGAKNLEEVDEAIHEIINKIKNVGLPVSENPEIKTQNIVASSDLKKELQLGSLAKALSAENAEYAPEQFPGLVYRIDNLGAVLLLFSSGKLVCTGAKKMEDVTTAIDTIKDKLSSMGIL